MPGRSGHGQAPRPRLTALQQPRNMRMQPQDAESAAPASTSCGRRGERHIGNQGPGRKGLLNSSYLFRKNLKNASGTCYCSLHRAKNTQNLLRTRLPELCLKPATSALERLRQGTAVSLDCLAWNVLRDTTSDRQTDSTQPSVHQCSLVPQCWALPLGRS